VASFGFSVWFFFKVLHLKAHSMSEPTVRTLLFFFGYFTNVLCPISIFFRD
jgi:hypothetical protein